MIPHATNFCGGNFQNWLEVNLTSVCNGKCKWCIEKDGYHPTYIAEWDVIANQAIKSGKENIILLGGEPTLHPDFSKIVKRLVSAHKKVWVTTNGSKLDSPYVRENLVGVAGVNISIHDSNMVENRKVTGINLFHSKIKPAIQALHELGASVRLNCNCIKGHVDSLDAIYEYIEYAKFVGADKIRFAELKGDDDDFVSLAELFSHQYGLNDDPFTFGCNKDAIINGMPVNFRQMCGLQTPKRPTPVDPEQARKTVLYYDGKFYDGWQTENKMTDKELISLLREVANRKLTVAEAAIILTREREIAKIVAVKEANAKKPKVITDQWTPLSGGGCNY